MAKKFGVCFLVAAIICSVFLVGAPQVQAATTVYVWELQPSWTAAGGGGVWSSYAGPPSYVMVSPGTTQLYLGREAGIIKAGLAVDPTSGVYEDDGLFSFQPNATINVLAAGPLTYDVVNQYGENPVWMTIEIDTGVLGDRDDDTVYQFVPTTNPTGWHTVNAAAGQWQQWADYQGTLTGTLMTLSQVATANTGLNVTRVFLRLGMGDSFHGTAGLGTVAWVDKATIGEVTYDFVVQKVPLATPSMDWWALTILCLSVLGISTLTIRRRRYLQN